MQVAAQRFVGKLPYTVPINGTLEIQWIFDSNFTPQVHLIFSRDSTVYFTSFLSNSGPEGSYLLDTEDLLLQPLNHSLTIRGAANNSDVDGTDTQIVIVTNGVLTSSPTTLPHSSVPTPASSRPSHAPSPRRTPAPSDMSEPEGLLATNKILEIGLAAFFTIFVFCCVYQICARYNSRKRILADSAKEQQFYVALFDSPSVVK